MLQFHPATGYERPDDANDQVMRSVAERICQALGERAYEAAEAQIEVGATHVRYRIKPVSTEDPKRKARMELFLNPQEDHWVLAHTFAYFDYLE